MENNEISKQATGVQRKFLRELEYCLCAVSDVLLPGIEIAYESLEIGNTRFDDNGDLVLFDVHLPYTVEDVSVAFKVDEYSGTATIRFAFTRDNHYIEYDFSGSVDEANCDKAELDFVKFLIRAGGKLDPRSPYMRLIEDSTKTSNFLSSQMKDHFQDGMK